MKIFVQFFALVLVGVSMSASAVADYQTYEVFYSENTDDFRLTHFKIESATGRYNLLWPYQNEKEGFHIWNFSFERGIGRNFVFSELSTAYSKKFSKTFSLDAYAGLFQFQNDVLNSSHTTSSYGAHATYLKNEKLFFYSLFERSFLIQEGALAADVSKPIWALSAKQILVWRSSDNWKHETSYRHRWIEDGNSRDDFEISSMYALSTYPDWIMIGASGSYSSFRERSVTYWSPKSVSMVGLKFDLAIPFRDDFTFKLGGVVGPAKEHGASTTVSDYIKAAVSYGSREGRNFELYGIDSRSTRSDGEWSAQTIGLSYLSNF